MRRQEAEVSALGAKVACIVGLDQVRTKYFLEHKPGPYVALSDASARVGALYGVARQLLVHDEWVNAPCVFIVKDGKIAWKHVGKSWGDRPTMEKILEEIKRVER